VLAPLFVRSFAVVVEPQIHSSWYVLKSPTTCSVSELAAAGQARAITKLLKEIEVA